MSTFDDINEAIEAYERNYRHPDLPRLNISGPYDLFPASTEPWPNSTPAEHRWPDVWPNSEKRGIYLIFDQSRNLLYVGKASMSSSIGVRLGKYFGSSDDGPCCRVLHTGWGAQPRFVVTVAVPDASPFEAPAIEEYLITLLSPSDNSKGIVRNHNG